MRDNKNKPPRLIQWILKNNLPDNEKRYLIGGIEEKYLRKITENGRIPALFWYLKETMCTLPYLILDNLSGSRSMFQNYLKIGLRNIKKHKIHSLINVSGLAVGMACSIIVLLLIQDDLSYDKFHDNPEKICRVITGMYDKGQTRRFRSTPAPLGPALENAFSGIANVSRIRYAGKSVIKYGNKSFYENEICFAEPSFFEIFNFPFISGDPKTALAGPASVVITEEIAQKYFNEENPVGKIITFDNKIDFTVSGVIKDVPLNSSIRFQILFPLKYYFTNIREARWDSYSCATYVLLQKDETIDRINELLPEWAKSYTGETVNFYFQPLTDVHLYAISGDGAIIYLVILSAITVLVILIGCINFINLSTGRSITRGLEIGLRKVMGANRKDIIRQCLGESTLIAGLSLIFALLLAYLAVPYLNIMSGKELSLNFIKNPSLIIGCIGITLITGIIAGGYPAFFLSSFQPVKVLKSTLMAGPRKLLMRRILVITQFAVTIIFLISTTVMNKQIFYLLNKDVGFDKQHMIILPVKETNTLKYNALKNELLTNTNIVNVTAGSTYPLGPSSRESERIDWEGKDPEMALPMYFISVDDNYLETYGMEIVEGRNFSQTFSTDTSNYILNETAVEAMGLESPIGKQFSLYGRTGKIIGIVKDFNFHIMTIKIRPLILRMMPVRYSNYIFVKTSQHTSGTQEIIPDIKNAWTKHNPAYPFEYEFLADKVDKENRDGAKIPLILRYITFFAIYNSCLGLFGLISLLTEQQTKEIAIRKVLGATIPGIVSHLSKELMKLVFLASITAIPAAWFISKMFLESFAYRTNISWTIYVVSAGVVIAVAFISVSFRVIKAAVSNPVHSLRYE